MKVAIVKYNAGNIRSVINALRRLGVEPVLTDDPVELRQADRVLFPGQGEARQAMTYLRDHGLDTVLRSLTQPVLGICIGQQLLCRHSEEGDTPCLGIFPTDVQRFIPARHEDKVPHMGWNQLHIAPAGNPTDTNAPGNPASAVIVPSSFSSRTCPLFAGIPDGAYVYFVHSYYVPLCDFTTAATDYILPFSSALQRDNFYATQFHPEKSGDVGERIIQNFLNL